MPKITLKISGQDDYETDYPVVTIGRTADNNIALNDSNVSRYHARIEQREDGFWLVEQGSSNGTSVNGIEVDGEILLQPNDVLLFGGTSQIVFTTDEETADEEDEEAETSAPVAAPVIEEKPAKSSPLLLVAGVVVGLAMVSVVTAGIVYWVKSGSNCEATARIKSPSNGKVLTETTEVEIDVTNPQCVQTAVFLLDGKEFASSSNPPFGVSINPEQFGDLADGVNHNLKVVLIDPKGEKKVQSDEIALAFETLETEPPPTPEVIVENKPGDKPTTKPASGKQVGVIETQEMARNLLKKNFPNAPSYKLDQQFLVEVNKKSAEYVTEGYYAKAAQYKDQINSAYYEQNLDAPLGFILAMSRSKFNPQKQGAEEGIWRMSNELVTNNNYNGLCGTETIGDALQNCAAKASAIYLKAILLNIFEGDIVYSVAAFGMSPEDAAQWKSTLPQNKMEFGKLIKSPKQREEVVKFFAAGIVAENPQRFGLKKDRPISEHYKLFVGNQ